MQVTRWQETYQPTESELKQRLEAQGLHPYVWSNGPGYVYGVHQHHYTKVLYCVCGTIRFMLPTTGDAVDLEPGDLLVLDAGTPHGALVGDQGVTCIEAPREG
jgi:quercetin dioxygenase-like cupin family protein